MKKTLCAALVAAGLAAGTAVQAQQPREEVSLSGQPHSWTVRGEPAKISGAYGARWGMDIAQVKAAIAAAWPSALATAQMGADDAAGTLALEVTLPTLAPGPGPARISYVFSADERRLVGVHSTWAIAGNPAEAERAPLLSAAAALASEQVGYQWPVFATARGRVVAPGELVVFAGRDEAGAGVEIRLGGAAFDVELPGAQRRQEHRAAPAGPAVLRQTFVVNAAQDALHEIKGFRSARFGMDEQQVRAAVAADFKEQAKLLQQAKLPGGARVLVLPLAQLSPGPGPAGVTYIFDGPGGKLVQVNLLWSTSQSPDAAERNRLAAAGVKLADSFRALKWRPKAATMGVPIGQQGVALFSGIDVHKAMVEVSLLGVPVRGPVGETAGGSGPAKLRVAYVAVKN
ncbi:hypothetical protein ACN9MY_23510 [Pseudoduganella sp. R-31]|uniref:hypothetical protein n=1 Tax=Pseudoduganella sp. R-31 TaxID=3404060 RepID=UPI003CEF5DE7